MSSFFDTEKKNLIDFNDKNRSSLIWQFKNNTQKQKWNQGSIYVYYICIKTLGNLCYERAAEDRCIINAFSDYCEVEN